MSEHLPAIQVALPLLAAPLALLLRHGRLVRLFTILVSWGCLATAVALMLQVQASGTISYHMGGWAPPLGIEYRIDLLNSYLLVLVTAIAAVVLPFGSGTAGISIPKGKEYLFYASFLLCLAGLLGIASTGDLFNVFVFLEISSLSSYTLISLGRDRRALSAAFSYLIMGTIGGTFLLIGIGFLYQMTGTLNMADLAQRLPEVMASRTTHAAFAFMVVGTSIKLAVFPLHQWLPNAYTHAPHIVSAFLAATATKVSYYVLARTVFGIFGAGWVFGVLKLDLILIPLSIVAMFVGSLAAIFQTDIKRLLAYSSIAQVGYMTLGLGFATVTGLTGGIVHLFNHALMKGGLFLVVACIAHRLHATRIEDLRGIGKEMPITMGAFVVGGLSLIGVPGTVGFVSKWYLVLAALEKGWYPVAALILLSSLLAVVYIWRIVEVAYFKPAPEGRTIARPPLSMLIPTWVLIGATVFFGLFTDLTVGGAADAAHFLLGVSP